MKLRSQNRLCAQSCNKVLKSLFNKGNVLLNSVQPSKTALLVMDVVLVLGCSGGGQCSELNGVTACHCDGCTSKQEPHETCTSTFCSSAKLDDEGCKGCCLSMLNGCAASGSCNNSHCKCNNCEIDDRVEEQDQDQERKKKSGRER
ncbi:Hypothetical predicted protein [Mytilus galloprovincialis]|uniref:Uncharacterized protein n=1 Tax=Mytilus galloprovincialis TaxID=29158 RepID=A0A8B6FE42_MYTGA|nr:Hypothetical predicted protein [Mytilus galloprovincialis]